MACSSRGRAGSRGGEGRLSRWSKQPPSGGGRLDTLPLASGNFLCLLHC